jgi:hypothetical protein
LDWILRISDSNFFQKTSWPGQKNPVVCRVIPEVSRKQRSPAFLRGFSEPINQPNQIFNFLWREMESNHRHRRFRHLALPTELPLRFCFLMYYTVFFRTALHYSSCSKSLCSLYLLFASNTSVIVCSTSP